MVLGDILKTNRIFYIVDSGRSINGEQRNVCCTSLKRTKISKIIFSLDNKIYKRSAHTCLHKTTY